MNERQWWSSHVKLAWHKPLKQWLAWKIQDEFFGGMPDSICMANGAVAIIEVKYEPDYPTRADTVMFVEQSIKPKGKGLSVKQRNRLEEWAQCGGRAWVFFGVKKEGYLISIDQVPKEGMAKRDLLNACMIHCPTYQDFPNVMDYLESLGEL